MAMNTLYGLAESLIGNYSEACLVKFILAHCRCLFEYLKMSNMLFQELQMEPLVTVSQFFNFSFYSLK